MKNHWLIAVSLSFMAYSASLRADEDVTVMAVGDSITQGGKSFHCYREFLIPMLSENQTKIRFVGPNQDQLSAHCGYGGKNTSYLNGIISEVYSKYPADIVLLHSGHNSFSKDKPVSKIVEATEEMIETVHSLNLDVTILLAQVIPSGKLPKYSYIPALNSELRKSANRMKSKGIHVIPVNQAEGFDWRSDTIEDKVHPNESGAQKMAERWMVALKPILAQRQNDRRGKNATGEIDATTLHHKVLCGYQGWFRCPGDGTNEGWLHWSRRRNITADSLTVEMWPDLTEFGDREKYAVPEFTTPDNQPASLFSSADATTVDRHFQWMQQYGIDGVFLQRFLVNLKKPSFDTVLSHVRTAAQKSGRAYAICYDLSGTPEERLYDSLVNDWKRLVDDEHVTQDDRYLHHNGKPVLYVWGFFDDRFDATTAHRIFDFFQADSRYAVTLIGGCKWYWRVSVHGLSNDGDGLAAIFS
jgi:lysophospholipase L1-like esterase